ncbi:MAG: glutamate 5-kinase [Clostridia bacterium]|nr:glutamate 5-kinase [Clostridia bacterium]
MNLFENSKRIVVKVGTSTLTHENGKLNLRTVNRLVRTLSDLRNSGKEIILVSSGAIGVGVGKLNLTHKPYDIGGRQACAAVGQCELMYIYDKLFLEYGYVTGQVLLTRDITEDEIRKRNVQNTFVRLLDMGALPVVNENDTVSTEELEFGDNDTLSAIVAGLTMSDTLIMLTDIDGLYDRNPRECESANLIHYVSEITDEIRSIAGGRGSTRGTGGMITKVQAAQMAMESGITAAIINGHDPENIYRLLDGEEIGTVFYNGRL